MCGRVIWLLLACSSSSSFALQSMSKSVALYEEDNEIAMEQKKQRDSVVLDKIPFGGWDLSLSKSGF